MPLSRLQNFLRNPQGRILYVDSNNFDATDDYTNRGDSLTRPFFSLQRALIEAAAFSYQSGVSNDKNDKTTIIVYPGEIYIDNRPGVSITNNGGTAQFKKRVGQYSWGVDLTGIPAFNEDTNFDIFDENNILYKFNSVEGGVILPRGTSVVALDLRKTKVKPLYVPDPENDSVDRSSIFKLTGNCYLTAFTFFDADPSTPVYKDYTETKYNPDFSHHKLTAFTYADGINKVRLGYEQTDLTDLQMYYYKVAEAYSSATGTNIPDFPENNEISPVIDEYRIVGRLEENLLGISSIRSGDGLGGGNRAEITVQTCDLITKLPRPHNLSKYTQFSISGIEDSPQSYNGLFFVKNIINETTFTYTADNVSESIIPTPSESAINNALIKVENDTVSSSSPYIFNCSLRSVYGMCGLWADGAKADGFKSVVVAQFTGISLQIDDNAFLLYNGEGSYLDNTTLSPTSLDRPLHTNSKSIYKPEYESFHIKASSNAFIQCVSIFAIGFARHFLAESGGDMSITNSNSNFGAVSLESSGFRSTSFDRDDTGYITHIIPPREIISTENSINWLQLDVPLTISSGINSRLYIHGYKNKDVPPPHKIDGYRLGARVEDKLYLISKTDGSVLSSPILMPVNSGEGASARKIYQVDRTGITNNITSGDTIVFTDTHQFLTGEKVRIYSDTGELPDGLDPNEIYYAVRTSDTSIKLSYNYNDATEATPITISNIGQNGGVLTVVSSVSDKLPGEEGHPIQYSTINGNWYIQSSSGASNEIFTEISTLGEVELGQFTSYSYFTRKQDNRALRDKIYKLRYVIPKEYKNAREPEIGYVLQESKSVGITTISNNLLSNLTIFDDKNEKIISSISAGAITDNSQLVTAKTEKAHNFIAGDLVKVNNVKSSFNLNAVGITSTFNGSFEVLSTPNFNTFTYRISGVSTNPGVFTSPVNIRTTSTDVASLPTVSRQQYLNTFFIYRVDTVKKHIPGASGQDGIYHLTILSSNIGAYDTVGYGLSAKKFNQDERNLYPQLDRDNLITDPDFTVSFSDYKTVGKVSTSNKQGSVTKEALNYFIQNTKIGIGITGVSISGVGNTTITLYTDTEHKLNSIKALSVVSAGTGYTTSYNSSILIGGNPTDAICGFTTSSGGSINSSTLKLNDRGSAFTSGQTVTIQGGNNNATFTVSEVNNHLGNGLELEGFFQKELNGVFEIVGIPNSKEVRINIPNGIDEYVPNTNDTTGMLLLSSDSINITSLNFTDINTGIVTATTSKAHGLIKGNKISIVGSGHTIFDSSFLISEVPTLTTFTFNVGIVTETKSSNKGKIFRRTLSTNGSSTGKTGENLASRGSYIYAGISTTLTALTDTQITLANSNGFSRGDYIQHGEEIIRLTSLPTGNVFNILRGVFGTPKVSATSGEVVKKIKIIPIELRRPSFLRASGHTFEYLGYGPGNYSTAIPQKQDRKLTEDEVLASQSRELSGGYVVYSGMNDLGEFYTRSKKYNTPVVTFTGDDADGTSADPERNGIFDSLTVDGDFTVNGSSTFNGKVLFNDDLKVKRLSIQNKLFTVDDISVPVDGNISYVGGASSYIGKVYTGGSWKPWGLISDEENRISIRPDKIVVGDLTVTGNTNLSAGITLDSGRLVNLLVTGIATFSGSVKGNSGTLNIQDNVFSSGRISAGSSFVGIVSTGEITYTGISTLTIKSTHSSGSINIQSNNNKNSIFKVESSGNFVAYGNNSGTGGSGTQLSIFNDGTGDAILAWRTSSGTWFAGIDRTNADSSKPYGNNAWKLAYINGSGNLIADFNSSTTKLAVTTDGTLIGNIGGNIPVGGIIIWGGSLAQLEDLEPNWVLCDGRFDPNSGNNVPDLRERFIVGAGGRNTTYPVDGGRRTNGYSVGERDGSSDAVLITHGHALSGDGAHQHQYTSYDDADSKDGNGGTIIRKKNSFLTSTPAGQGGHSHTVEPSGNSNGVNANLPPYYALCYIIRVS